MLTNDLSSGIGFIDDMLDGGFQPGMLYAVLGKCHSFKTGLMAELVNGVRCSNKGSVLDVSNPVVMVFNLEETYETFNARFPVNTPDTIDVFTSTSVAGYLSADGVLRLMEQQIANGRDIAAVFIDNIALLSLEGHAEKGHPIQAVLNVIHKRCEELEVPLIYSASTESKLAADSTLYVDMSYFEDSTRILTVTSNEGAVSDAPAVFKLTPEGHLKESL